MGHNRFMAVSPAYTPIYDMVWTTIQDSIVYSGWPGNNVYYRFVPVDTVCPPTAVVGVRGSWQSPGTVQLVWNRCDWHSSYTVEYGYEGFSPGTGTVVSTTDTSVTLTGLCEGQNYDAYVRADCPDSLLSPAVLVQFQSPCVPSAENRIPFYDLTASGVACYTGTTSAPSSTVGIVDSGSLSPYSRHTVHTNPLERDPYTYNQLYTIPAGHCLSVRLGNWRIWSEQESITYTLHVDTNDYDLLVLRYALVQEYNVHPVQYNPQFEFDITDVQGNRISDCYHGLFLCCRTTIRAGTMGWTLWIGATGRLWVWTSRRCTGRLSASPSPTETAPNWGILAMVISRSKVLTSISVPPRAVR